MPNPVIQVRVSEETLAEIDKRGNRSDVIRAALAQYIDGGVAVKVVTTEGKSQLCQVATGTYYQRPAHAIDCKCLMCKPPKTA